MPITVERLLEQAEDEVDPEFRSDAWFGPRVVTLDGDVLRFSPDDDKSRPLLPTKGLLRAFTRLRNADGPAIERFARLWGRLYLCDHGLPSSHHALATEERGPVFPEPSDEDHDPFWDGVLGSVDVPLDYYPSEPLEHPARVGRSFGRGRPAAPQPEDIQGEEWANYEPVAAWRGIARRMAAIVEIALLLKAEDQTKVSLWGDAGGPLWESTYERFGQRRPELLGPFVRNFATRQLAIAAPRLVVGPHGLVVGGGLAQALAMQLALTVAGQRSAFLQCSEDGCINPAETPRMNAKPYCGAHVKTSRNRDDQARFRARARSIDGLLALARDLPAQLDELVAEGTHAAVEPDDSAATTVTKLRRWAGGIFRAAVAALGDPQSARAAEVQLRALLEVCAHLTWISHGAEPKSLPDDRTARALRIELGIVEERTHALAKASDNSLPEPRATMSSDLGERKDGLVRMLAARGAPVMARGHEDVEQTLIAFPPELQWMTDAWAVASMASPALAPDRNYPDAGAGESTSRLEETKERLVILNRLLDIYAQCAAAILTSDGDADRIPAFDARINDVRRHAAFGTLREG
jgi:hypothetical protein